MTDRDPQLASLLDRLNPPFELMPDWKDALDRAQHQSTSTPKPRWRIPLLAASLAAALCGAALVLGPWRHGPTIVGRAGAALSLKPGTVVYERFEATSTNLRTGVTLHGTKSAWLTANGRFRSVQFVAGQRRLEQGRLRAGLPLLTYSPGPNELTASCGSPIRPVDPVQAIRRDLQKGTLKPHGSTTVDHREAELLIHASPGETDYLYVDPHSYVPIELRSRLSTPAGTTVGVIKFLDYKRLPATTTNLALTNIRLEHPHARLAAISNYTTPC